MLRVGLPPASQTPDPTSAPDPTSDPTQAPDPTPDPTQDPTQDSGPKMKVSQDVVVYMGGDLGPFKCANCNFFQAPNACAIVDGEIDPEGCCDLFTPSDFQGGEGQGDDEGQEVTPDNEGDEGEDENGQPN